MDECICDGYLRQIDYLQAILLFNCIDLFVDTCCQSIPHTCSRFPLIQIHSYSVCRVWDVLHHFIHHFGREISPSGRICPPTLGIANKGDSKNNQYAVTKASNTTGKPGILRSLESHFQFVFFKIDHQTPF